MEELKPCPFCGSNPELAECTRELPMSEEQDIFYVICTHCGCSPFRISGPVNLRYQPNCKVIIDELKMKAIEKWNRRAKT